MTWARHDDQAWSNPKLLALDDRAERLYWRAISWCACHLTDGQISRKQLLALDAMTHRKTDATGRANGGGNRYSSGSVTLSVLEAAGFIEPGSIGYVIHHYLDYNPTREQVLRDRHAAKERMAVRRNTAARSPERSPEQAPCSPSPSRPVPNYKDLRSRARSPEHLAPLVQEVQEGSRMRLRLAHRPPDEPPLPDSPPPDLEPPDDEAEA